MPCAGSLALARASGTPPHSGSTTEVLEHRREACVELPRWELQKAEAKEAQASSDEWKRGCWCCRSPPRCGHGGGLIGDLRLSPGVGHGSEPERRVLRKLHAFSGLLYQQPGQPLARLIRHGKAGDERRYFLLHLRIQKCASS